MKRVAIVGGGLAGLAAAVHAQAAGAEVSLFEARNRLGGRCFSVTDRESGVAIDNGQHALMGCYHATLRYLRLCGAEHLLDRLQGLSLQMRHVDGRVAQLTAGALPPPFGPAMAFLRYGMLRPMDRLRILRVALTLRFMNEGGLRTLDALSAEDWLRSLGQGEEAIAYFWAPVVLATLNADIREASAYLLAVVLRAVFLTDARAMDILLPRAGLSDVLIEPARSLLEQGGVRIVAGNAVQALLMDHGRVVGLRDAGGVEQVADAVILAVAPWHCAKLLGGLPIAAPLLQVAGHFHPSPILSAHLWLRRDPGVAIMTGGLGGALQWVFGKGTDASGNTRISCTISAAAAWERASQQELRDMIVRELLRLYPSLSEQDVLRVVPLLEHRATFLPSPGMEAVRPSAETSIGGLYLAGDWTATSLPATIESAVLSGERAVAAMLGMWSRS